jgi:hypothetical protein
MTVEEFRQRLRNITLTAKTEEGQVIADDLVARVLAAITDDDIIAELQRKQSVNKQRENE